MPLFDFFGAKKKKKVLVVEDDPAIRGMIGMILADAGCELIEAENGQAGVEAAQQHMPDLIIMDVMMPVMSGFDATQAIRADPKVQAIPIIMCTARDKMADVEKSLTVGANDYLPKPINVPRFKAKVAQYIGAF
ncbi:MAG: response regulator [Elusimicrobia bacterium]|nr:response regulator [Elusimicrobiota bacterium]